MSSAQTIDRIFDNETAERAFGFAQATRLGELLFVSGTLAVDDSYTPVGDGDIEMQLKCIYQRLGTTLAGQGLTFADVVRENVFVTSMDAMLAANHVRLDTYGDHLPACTVVEVTRLAFPPCMAEIEIIARIPGYTPE